MSQRTIYSIGHSTHPLNDFIAMLRSRNVSCLVDVRSYPGSGTNPQYNKESGGGHHFMETPIGDYVITWALPESAAAN